MHRNGAGYRSVAVLIRPTSAQLCRKAQPDDPARHAQIYAVDCGAFKENRQPSLRDALHFVHYNFARICQSIRCTPAMEAGISSHVWSIEELVRLSN